MNTVIGWSLILSAVWWVLQMGFVTTFFVIGQPYGALSNQSNAMNVICLLPLAMLIHIYTYQSQPLLSLSASAVGAAGVLLTAVASYLIMGGKISFAESLPPVMAGFSAIGVWLLAGFLMLRGLAPLPATLVNFGVVVGIGLAAIGLLFLWGDIQAGFTGGAIWSNPLIYPVLALVATGFFGLPVWSLLLGRHLLMLSNG